LGKSANEPDLSRKEKRLGDQCVRSPVRRGGVRIRGRRGVAGKSPSRNGLINKHTGTKEERREKTA